MFKSKSVPIETRHKLILAGITVLIVAGLASILLYTHFLERDAIKRQIDFFQKTHDSTYTSAYLLTDKVQSIYNQLLGDNRISEWMHHRNDEDMYTMRLIQNSFVNLINSYSEIVSIYLHNQSRDLILSTEFRLSKLEHFPDKEVFENYYGSGRTYLLSPVRSISGDNRKPLVLSFTAGIPYNGRLGSVTINLDAKQIRDNLLSRNPHALWIDDNGHVLLAADDTIAMYEQMGEALQENGYFQFHDVHVFVTSHPKKMWKLATVVPHAELMQGVNRNYSYIYVMIGMAVLLVALVIWYIRKMYQEPIQQYQTKLEQSLTDLQHEFFVSLVTGKNKADDIVRKAKEYGLDLDGVYRIVVLQIDDYYNYLLNMSGENRFLINKLIFNSIIWTFKVRFNAHPIKTDFDKVSIMLCTKPGEDDEGQVNEVIRYLQKDIMDNCGLTVCAGISPQFDRLDQAPIEYSHAVRALEYKTIYGKQSIIRYEDIANKTGTYDQYPIEQIDKLIDHLRKSDMDAVRSTLDEIVEDFLHKDFINPQLINAVFANIMSGVTKTIMESRFSVDDLFEEDVFITLYSYDVLEDKKAYLLHVCEKVVEFSRNKKQYVRNKTAQMILDYIHQNYDKPISLTILADEMNMNPSYLSAFIKNNIGIRFVDYISQLRIQKAVKLLMDDNLTIQEIAERCGYDTVHSFIRNFKKKYNMPPNEYRLQLRSQKNNPV